MAGLATDTTPRRSGLAPGCVERTGHGNPATLHRSGLAPLSGRHADIVTIGETTRQVGGVGMLPVPGRLPVTTIAATCLLLDDALVCPGWVTMEGATIAAVGSGAPPQPVDVRLDGGVLAPGLVDLQLNGAFGHDLASADRDGWQAIARGLPSTGVTAFVPTVITAPMDALVAAMRRYRDLREDLREGARTLGLHLEGPFLAEGRRGAHAAEHLRDPTPERVDQLLEAGGEDLAYVTLAPERAGAIAAIERFVGAGVRVAVGHSDATDVQVAAAADAGATLVTHLFNAQRPLHHRDPGVVGAALADPRLTLGLIVDGHHVAPTAVRATFAAAAGRTALVTDAISALGMPPGSYDLGGARIHVRDDGLPVRDDGTIAGSTLRLDAAIAGTIEAGVDPATALTAATRVPADAIGRRDLGRLASGAAADLVWWDDGRARATWVRGGLVHGDPPSAGATVRSAEPDPHVAPETGWIAER